MNQTTKPQGQLPQHGAALDASESSARVNTVENGTDALKAALAAIGERLRTQDNLATENPMFCVQEKRRIIGIDSAYSETRCWLDSGNETVIYDDDTDFKEPPTGGEWEVFGYIDEWHTVMAAFTRVGCEEYLRQNAHNLKETRIYVESFRCCPEMLDIRRALMGGVL